MTPKEYEKLFDESMEVLELLEDTVAFHCNEKQISGQKVWNMIAAAAVVKLQDFPDNFNPLA
tara:strand:- start:369 stop:554 length:186 start_codon:yes stop_codon:yes gene_type:complete